MCCLFINDLDAGAGRFGLTTQYTVNNQMVNATLMNIADNPTNVQLPGVYKNEEIPRVPIICTGAFVLLALRRGCRLCCAALCCAVLRCAALCCAVLRCAALCCAVLRCAALCCAVLRPQPAKTHPQHHHPQTNTHTHTDTHTHTHTHTQTHTPPPPPPPPPTGNDFSTLYAPLIRDGRMDKYYWNPTREDRIGVCMGIFAEDNVTRGDVEVLVDAFPGQSIDFFGALRARVYDDKVRGRGWRVAACVAWGRRQLLCEVGWRPAALP
jgi:hypothetical protein